MVVFGGMIASLYVTLTMVSASMGLASGVIQVRLSESLCLLPCLIPAAVPGLTVGCLLANWITGCLPMDIFLGSLATLIGAVGTRMMKNTPQWSWIPPVTSNVVIVPLLLIYAYHVQEAWWFLVLTVGAGELISCGLLGLMVYQTAKKRLIGYL